MAITLTEQEKLDLYAAATYQKMINMAYDAQDKLLEPIVRRFVASNNIKAMQALKEQLPSGYYATELTIAMKKLLADRNEENSSGT